MKKFLKALNPWHWAKNAFKKELKEFVDAKWEAYEKEAIEYVSRHGAGKLKELSDKWQVQALAAIDRL